MIQRPTLPAAAAASAECRVRKARTTSAMIIYCSRGTTGFSRFGDEESAPLRSRSAPFCSAESRHTARFSTRNARTRAQSLGLCVGAVAADTTVRRNLGNIDAVRLIQRARPPPASAECSARPGRDRRDQTDMPLRTASTWVAGGDDSDSEAGCRSTESFPIEIYAIRFVFIFNWLATVPRRALFQVNRTSRAAKQRLSSLRDCDRTNATQWWGARPGAMVGCEARCARLAVVVPLANKPRAAAGPLPAARELQYMRIEKLTENRFALTRARSSN
jgi:hypothetical protein